MEIEQYIWVEKYRPRKIDECILAPELKNYFHRLVEENEIPNLLLSGNAGCGKTTVAKALCEELDAEYLFINGSEESGIDTLRYTIKNFALSKSLNGNTKVVIIDEADYLQPNSFQPAFRSFMEEYSSNCRFILTCNNKNKLIKPLHSRLTNIDFKLKTEDQPNIAMQFFKRLSFILNQEKVEINNDVIAAIIKKFFPDFRKTIVELQRNCHNGKISDKILSMSNDMNMDSLLKSLKAKEWKEMRQWVVDNIADYDVNDMFRSCYDYLREHTDQTPHLVVLLNQYQHSSAFVADQEINFVAFLTEVMANVEFK